MKKNETRRGAMKAYKKGYPRPQLVRKDWIDLNGAWDFQFDDENQGEWEKWYTCFPQDHL